MRYLRVFCARLNRADTGCPEKLLTSAIMLSSSVRKSPLRRAKTLAGGRAWAHQ